MQTPAVEYFYKAKWPGGFQCPRCGHNHAYEITSRKMPLYQCNCCRHQTSLTAGTIIENSRTPLEKWYIAMQRMSEPGGTNAVQLMHAIGVTYKTAWSMLKKVREAISDFDCEQPLSGTIRAEMTFYGLGNRMPRKRHPKEHSCVIMAEFRPEKPLTEAESAVETTEETTEETVDETMNKPGKSKLVEAAGGVLTDKRLLVEDKTPAESQSPVTKSMSRSVQLTGSLRKPVFEVEQCQYVKLKVANPAYMHNRKMPQVLQPMFLARHVDASMKTANGKNPLIPSHCLGETPVLNRLARQAKETVNRTYRGIGPKYLQQYWDEFCFRFNLTQLKQPITDVLAGLCLRSKLQASYNLLPS